MRRRDEIKTYFTEGSSARSNGDNSGEVRSEVKSLATECTTVPQTVRGRRTHGTIKLTAP